MNSGVTKNKYLGTPCVLNLPTIDTVTDQIKALGKGCMMYKVDIRHIKLDPMDYNLSGLRHDCHYLDICLPFGYRNGSSIFQCISDAVCHMMCRRHFDVINCIDDILEIDVYVLMHHLALCINFYTLLVLTSLLKS